MLASIPKSGPEIQNHCTLEVVNGDKLAAIPKSGPEIQNYCTLEVVSGQKPAVIPKSGPEIQNHCTLEDISGQNHAAIPKSGPEIQNHCTLEVVSWQKPAVIPKSGLEIKNRCSSGFATTVCRRNHSLLPQRNLESAAEVVAATAAAGGPFFFAAKKIRIGRGRSSPLRPLQAGHSSLPQRKLESDAEGRYRDGRSRRAILRCWNENLNRTRTTLPLSHSFLASIRKSRPEIKNRCRKQHIPQHASCLRCLHGGGLDAGSTVAAKAGADAPGGGISLCFCRRGCAAPAKQAATLNEPRQTSRPAQRPAILNEKARLNIVEGGQSLCLPDFFK